MYLAKLCLIFIFGFATALLGQEHNNFSATETTFLVTKNGKILTIQGEPQISGNRITFNKDGNLMTLPLALIDMEASQEKTVAYRRQLAEKMGEAATAETPETESEWDQIFAFLEEEDEESVKIDGFSISGKAKTTPQSGSAHLYSPHHLTNASGRGKVHGVKADQDSLTVNATVQSGQKIYTGEVKVNSDGTVEVKRKQIGAKGRKRDFN